MTPSISSYTSYVFSMGFPLNLQEFHVGITVALKIPRKESKSKEMTNMCLDKRKKLFTPPHPNYSFHHHASPASIKEINSKKKICRLQKKKDKQKGRRRGIEEQYLETIYLSYHYLPPFSTHSNIPHAASELRKMYENLGER